MNVSTHSEKYSYADSSFNLSTVLVLMECRSVTHLEKKVLLYTTIQLPRLTLTVTTIAAGLMATVC